jgi:hypothetical protein
MVSPHSERSRFLRRSAGYGVVFRTQDWAECLITRGDESWLGHGLTVDQAFDHALRQMLPSRLARNLFEAQIQAQIAVAPLATASDEAPLTEAQVAPIDVAPTTTAEQPPVEQPTEAPPSLDVVEVAASAPVEALAAAAAPTEATPGALPHAAPVEPAPSGIQLAEALAALDGMLHDIDTQLPKLAKKSAERQRYQLLSWICRARAHEEALPDARLVTAAVQRIARRLSEIGKMLWPGSVRALQLATAPSDTLEPHATEFPPTTWAEAADRAEQRYREHIRKSTAAGFDEDGWIDAHPVGPAPREPDALLAQAVKDLEALLARPSAASTEEQDSTAILRIAQTLRWVRESAQDHLAWGLAMGRLRRVALPVTTTAALLRKTIDPSFRATSSWIPAPPQPSTAALQEESSTRLRAELLELGSGEDTLLPWLIRAFDTFPTPALADLLRSRRSQIAALGEIAATHEDRRIRRRLRDLIKLLASGGMEESPPSARREIAPPPPKDEEPESEDDSALRQLCDSVRQHTEGRRVLFASNRSDARLEARLTELLGVKMAGCDGGPRRVQSQCERISQGSYDLVLSATGFQDHAVDGALAHAASLAGIPYVRVNRGRPLACAQAIVRELGKLPATPSEAPTRPSLRVG